MTAVERNMIKKQMELTVKRHRLENVSREDNANGPPSSMEITRLLGI